MSTEISKLVIQGLHGYKNLCIPIENNRLILIGENGTGKTTLLRIFAYLLGMEWKKLLQNQFTYLSITINGKEIEIDRTILEEHFGRFSYDDISQYLSTKQKHYLSRMIDENEGDMDRDTIRRFCQSQSIPIDIYKAIVNAPDKHKSDLFLYTFEEMLKTAIDDKIVYLPTYRRIEHELPSQIRSDDIEASHKWIVDRRPEGNLIEMTRFGMKDIDKMKNEFIARLRDTVNQNYTVLTSNYLDDILKRSYATDEPHTGMGIQDSSIDFVLSRIDDDLMTADSKNSLRTALNSIQDKAKLDIYDKVILHYWHRLEEFHKEIQKVEEIITEFAEICNSYMHDKTITYNSRNFGFKVVVETDGQAMEIELNDLSSGEKQVVALFGQLYLSGINGNIIIIDEPELSLSVFWQKKFLEDILNCRFCHGLITATHSPFIYDNKLISEVRNISEFRTDS